MSDKREDARRARAAWARDMHSSAIRAALDKAEAAWAATLSDPRPPLPPGVVCEVIPFAKPDISA